MYIHYGLVVTAYYNATAHNRNLGIPIPSSYRVFEKLVVIRKVEGRSKYRVLMENYSRNSRSGHYTYSPRAGYAVSRFESIRDGSTLYCSDWKSVLSILSPKMNNSRLVCRPPRRSNVAIRVVFRVRRIYQPHSHNVLRMKTNGVWIAVISTLYCRRSLYTVRPRPLFK